jgi:thiosulfate dehydrogenase [quinone] large subunit
LTKFPDLSGSMITASASKALAVLRLATGFVFLWAFLDKVFGLGYATPSARAWIHDGSPTLGFLKSVDAGPARSVLHSIAGTWWADGLFMTGLLGIGIALIAGVALRPAAASGVVMMALMWLAEFPPARHTASGVLTGSVNPLTDYHLVYAIVLVVLAATYSGTTWGLGRNWARLRLVGRYRWLV